MQGCARSAQPHTKEPPCHPKTAGCSPAWTPWSSWPPTATGSPWPPGAAWPPPRHGPRPGPPGLTSTTRGPTPRGPAARGSALALRDAVELLRAVGEGVGLLRVRGDRLEATRLRHAWAQIDPGLRAGLVYAAWCQQVTFTG